MHRPVALVLTAATALAVPAAADAATKTVQVGPFGGAAQKEFQDSLGDANQYFRKTITVRKGDRVRWKQNGFHSVTFVPAGDAPPALVVPDPANPVAGVNDAAGAAFWFNGQPNLAPNPLAVASQGGKTFKRSELMNSGLPLTPGAPPDYVLRFNRKGTYGYLCVLHPGMVGTVKVVGENTRIPSARKNNRAAKRELNATLARVKTLTTGAGLEGLDKTIRAGNDRRTGPTVFKFFPAAPTYRIGDTVTLQMPPSSSEVHTLTFGPTNGKDAYNDQLAAALGASLAGPAFEPRGAYPSEPPPAGVPTYAGTNHGNGFYNSGLLDSDAASPLPASTQVRFGAAGSYPLICLIHPFMTATVTVTP